MNYDYESIRDRIKSHLQDEVNKVEGGFCMNNIGAVSQELAKIYAMEIIPIVDNYSLDTAEGIYLDKKALDFNEFRNEAKKSSGVVTFTGTPYIKISKGSQLRFEELTFSTTVDSEIDINGTVDVTCECDVEGFVGNIKENKIDTLISNISGVTNVTNTSPFTGGFDVEGDDGFRKRILEKIQKPIASGNENHYVYWAKQVSGVGSAKCIGCFNGAGTVKVIIINDFADVPDDTLINNVSNHIAQNRPIGASVTVSKGIPLSINITATLRLSLGFNIDTVKANIVANIKEHIKNIVLADQKYLSYYKIGDLIFNVDGVADIIDYTVNNAKLSINADTEQFFKLAEVIVNGS